MLDDVVGLGAVTVLGLLEQGERGGGSAITWSVTGPDRGPGSCCCCCC